MYTRLPNKNSVDYERLLSTVTSHEMSKRRNTGTLGLADFLEVSTTRNAMPIKNFSIALRSAS
jgi:hypothetical protein